MAATNRPIALLVEKAWEVAAILNMIEDDDAREQAQEKFEQVLNHELYCGSVNRRQFAPAMRVMADSLLASITGMRLRRGDG